MPAAGEAILAEVERAAAGELAELEVAVGVHSEADLPRPTRVDVLLLMGVGFGLGELAVGLLVGGPPDGVLEIHRHRALR